MKNYNSEEIESLINDATTINDSIDKLSEQISTAIEKTDIRLYDYFESLQKIEKAKNNIQDSQEYVDTYKSWLSDTYSDYTATVAANNDRSNSISNAEIDGTIGNNQVGNGTASLGKIAGITSSIDSVIGGIGNADQTEQYYLDPEDWANLPATDKDAIVNKLKELGFTDEEINKIKNGETSVDKVKLDELSSELEKLYKNDPSIRQKLKDLYGFDIFNDDGTINKEKLAIAMLIDGKNANDSYDIEALIKKLTTNSNSVDNKIIIPTSNDVEKITTSDIDNSDSADAETVVAAGTTAAGLTGKIASTKTSGLATGVKDSQKNDSKSSSEDSILDELSGQLNHVMNKIGSTIKTTGGNIGIKQGNAALVAGASLGSIGLTGTGIMAGKKIKMLKFTPENFEVLSQKLKDIIISDFKKAKFTQEEIDKFLRSTLKIREAQIDEIIKPIKSAYLKDQTLEQQIKDMYNFSFITDEEKINKYLLLLVMLIDGRTIADNYNLYDILNPILTEDDLKNFTYQGVVLNDIAVLEEKQEDNSQNQAVNQITDQANEREGQSGINDMNKENNIKTTEDNTKDDAASTKEWLKQFGIE